jgi:anti-sigma regulatory factor (Ser/Thr protein kinase)
MTEEYMIRIPAKTEGMDLILAFVGLGIYMVKTMVDELEYEYRDGCNRLMMRRRLHE